MTTFEFFAKTSLNTWLLEQGVTLIFGGRWRIATLFFQ
jgi:hypothetical protein